MFGGFSAQIVGVEDYPGEGDILVELLGLPHGSTVLFTGAIYGRWDPSGWPFNAVRNRHTFIFFDPVEEFSMVIYPENDSDLTCYNAGGGIVGTAAAIGAWRSGENQPIQLPYVEQTLRVAGSGIVRCDLDELGGAVDDIRFRRERNDLTVKCVGDLGENRVTRGEELVCTAKTGSETDQIEIETWSFSGADSNGNPYTYPEDLDGPVTDNPWRGKMVVGGHGHGTGSRQRRRGAGKGSSRRVGGALVGE